MEANEPDPPAPEAEAEPDPNDSDWARCLARHVSIPPGAGLARLRQLSDVQVKALKKQGRKRDAKELARLRDDWLRKAERRAWAKVKARFAELELSDKAYRALKQQGRRSPDKLLKRLNTRAAEDMRGAGAARVREWLES